MKFRAALEASGKNTAGFEVPEEIVDGLGGGRHPKVLVRLQGYEFRTSIARMGGRFLLGVSAERRAEAGVAAGDVLDVEVELDTAERTVEVPDDLAAALAEQPAAKEFFDSLSYSKQSWHVLQVTGAKKPETRAKRVATSVAMLAEGRAR
ncbi:YdeI/OmpD-associated family protein [Microlunatus parietis]|uniref:Bacteriocin-protection, YdeI or OmpD-Associated n=1 Tax=Microlunatus parietis TaxID=682979 RepID=A0A7Y9IBK5_9ACTN|nr:YdeI/OmpD-associated family protein [Microlunatus parietis]NYE73839.1 hypothetical protein [Microlunatus parietis]